MSEAEKPAGLPADRSIRRENLAADLIHPVLRQLYAYWDEKRTGRIGPTRAEIDPVDFRYAIGWTALVDVVGDGESFNVRVWGGNMSVFTPNDYTGRQDLKFNDGEIGVSVLENFRWVVTHRRPLSVLRDRTTAMGHYRYESMALPLSEDGKKVMQLLVTAIPPVGG